MRRLIDEDSENEEIIDCSDIIKRFKSESKESFSQACNLEITDPVEIPSVACDRIGDNISESKAETETVKDVDDIFEFEDIFADLNSFDESFAIFFKDYDDESDISESQGIENTDASGSDDEDDLLLDKKPSRKDKLAQWAVDSNVPLKTVDSLLKVLVTDFGCTELPLTGRTLLRTPLLKLPIREVDPGQYLHFGLKNGLLKVLKNVPDDVIHLTIDVNCDGLPISKSSGKCLWPILGSCNEIKGRKIPFIIGLYHGPTKPKDSNEFLKDFVKECQELICTGIIFSSKHYRFSVKRLVCDFPAKSFALKVRVSENTENIYFSTSLTAKANSLYVSFDF